MLALREEDKGTNLGVFIIIIIFFSLSFIPVATDYLDRVIKESLRIRPVGPIILRRAIHEDDILGNFIPAGANIIINLLQCHRDENWYQAEEFDPDRFCGREGKNHVYFNPSSYYSN